MKKPVFVRRSLDPSRVAAVEEIAAQAPIVGDPRIGAPAPAQPTQAAESQSAASVAPKDSLAAPQDSYSLTNSQPTHADLAAPQDMSSTQTRGTSNR